MQRRPTEAATGSHTTVAIHGRTVFLVGSVQCQWFDQFAAIWSNGVREWTSGLPQILRLLLAKADACHCQRRQRRAGRHGRPSRLEAGNSPRSLLKPSNRIHPYPQISPYPSRSIVHPSLHACVHPEFVF